MALCVVAAATAVGVAAAERPVTVQSGTLVVSANEIVAPRALSRTTPTPASLTAAGRVATSDGTHPPATREVMIESDGNVFFKTAGYPTCNPAVLQSRNTGEALAACRPALIGEGTTDVEVAFPGGRAIPVHSRLLAFNGGEANGVTTILIHAYVTLPTPVAVVVPVRMRRVNRGRYGLLSTARIPTIAGGGGSLIDFSLKLDRKFSLDGRRLSIVSALCPDGRLQAKITAKFSSGRAIHAELVRPCTPLG
jgi:hypothetical protein